MMLLPVGRAGPVQVLGDAPSMVDALASVQAQIADSGASAGTAAGVAIVSEGGLDRAMGVEVRRRLAAGEVVLILAQPESAATHYPVPFDLQTVEAGRDPPVFRFTTDCGALPSFPRRDAVMDEDSTIQARSVAVRVGDTALPDTPVVIACQPLPGPVTGTVVGSHQVGPGRLVFCQYQLCSGAANGDAAARAVLADLIAWASRPRRALVVEESRLADGRRVARYSHIPTVAR
jgi:hypothetical protein